MTRGYIDDALLLVPGTNYEYFGNGTITYAIPDSEDINSFDGLPLPLNNLFNGAPLFARPIILGDTNGLRGGMFVDLTTSSFFASFSQIIADTFDDIGRIIPLSFESRDDGIQDINFFGENVEAGQIVTTQSGIPVTPPNTIATTLSISPANEDGAF